MAGYLLVLLSAALLKGAVSAQVDAVFKQSIVKVGDPIEFICHVKSPVFVCRVVMPSIGSSIVIENKKWNDREYYGEGFARGDCGIRIFSAKESDNGQFECAITTPAGDTEMIGRANLTVAKTPTRPELKVNPPRRGSEFEEGEVLSAICTVKNGRPAANITWYIGDDKITDGLSQPVLLDLKPHDLYSIEQNLTRRIQATDNGKELKCVATHPLLNEKQNTSMKLLNVVFPPKEAVQPLEKFGLVEGEEGKISVTVMANPKPTFTWIIGEERLNEGEQDQTKRISALPGTPAEDGMQGSWDSVLVINPLQSEDVEKSYELLARNRLGEFVYKVVISTSPEPKMLELGAGAIIGIVVAVLLLLTVAALVLFARAKGRWCFGGASAQFAGESSDTESAEHHATHPKVKKTPFTSVFKKKSDKVSSEELQPKEAGEEEKRFIVSLSNFRKEGDNPEGAADIMLRPRNPDEGVVYAELDLNLAPGARPTPTVRPEEDKTEYAEIIHTKETK